MKRSYLIALVMAAAWCIIKWISAKSLSPEESNSTGVLVNILFILILVFVSLAMGQNKNTETDRGFLYDFRQSLKTTVIYIVTVVGFMALYYGVLSDDLQHRRDALHANLLEQTDTEDELAQYRSMVNRPELTREEIIAAETEKTEFFTSLKLLVPMSLLILTMVAVAYSLLGVFIWRRFLRR